MTNGKIIIFIIVLHNNEYRIKLLYLGSITDIIDKAAINKSNARMIKPRRFLLSLISAHWIKYASVPEETSVKMAKGILGICR